MIRSSLALGLFLSSVSAFAQQTGETVYLENSFIVRVYEADSAQDGVIIEKAVVPSATTYAISAKDLLKEIEEAQKDPNAAVSVRFLKPGNNRMETRADFVCGFRVIDVPDEELRDDFQNDEGRYCLHRTTFHALRAVEGMDSDIQGVVTPLLKANDVALLKAFVQKQDSVPRVFDIKAAMEVMASPLRDCGRGCLRATSPFNPYRLHPVLGIVRPHNGVDLKAAIGSPVVAALSGRILANRNEINRRTGGLKGYGHYVIMVHEDAGLQTYYAHLSRFSSRPGAKVRQGQLIAFSGMSGLGTGPHLHFEVRRKLRGGYVPVNPVPYLKRFMALLETWSRVFFTA